MKKFNLFLLVLILPLSFFLAQHNESKGEGRYIFPCFTENEDFVFLYEKEGGGIVLGEQHMPWGDGAFQEKFLIRGESFYPSIKKDKQGNIWAAWEERDSGRGDVFFALLEDGYLRYKEKASGKFEGENLFPSFDIDFMGNVWIVWINNFDGFSRVLVKEVESGKTWQVNSSIVLPAYTPKIVVDRKNFVWVFWVTQRKGEDEILFSCFNGEIWSRNSSLNRDASYPHINPEVCLDTKGNPWVVWSAYDEADYEIWLSFWNGTEWSKESRITDNQGLSDFFPHIAFLPENIPIISWSRSGEGSHIFIKYREKESWSEEIRISRGGGFNRHPRVVISGYNLGIVWENSRDDKSWIKTKIIPFSSLVQENRRKRMPSVFSFSPILIQELTYDVFPNPILNERECIAFGDSITYGVINRINMPEKGYVPRLELLLIGHFYSANVHNRGTPGEDTIEGLAWIDSVLQEDKAKHFLLMEGTIDMLDHDLPVETSAFNIEEMVKKCIQFGVYPLVSTIIPRTDSLWYLGVGERTIEFNKLVREIPPAYFLPLVDQYNSFIDHPDGLPSLYSDGAHPNEIGYQFMAETWFNSIKMLPYPPVNIRAEKNLDQILFYQEYINLISWEENPYLDPEVEVRYYRIFRKREWESYENYVEVGIVPGNTFEFLDRNINPNQVYDYCIQAESLEMIRGPASASVTSN